MRIELNFGAVSKRIPRGARSYVRRLWLVGSQARGDANSLSDVDILIEAKEIDAAEMLRKIRPLLRTGDRADTLLSYWDSGKNQFSRGMHFVIAKPGEQKAFPERIRLN